MIDIHSHIVFDVDDGPKTIEDSKLLIEESYRQGVRTIVSTSHRRKGMFETPEEKIYQILLDRFHLKSEDCIFVDDKLENIQAAERLGFTSYHCKDSSQLPKELEGIL